MSERFRDSTMMGIGKEADRFASQQADKKKEVDEEREKELLQVAIVDAVGQLDEQVFTREEAKNRLTALNTKVQRYNTFFQPETEQSFQGRELVSAQFKIGNRDVTVVVQEVTGTGEFYLQIIPATIISEVLVEY